MVRVPYVALAAAIALTGGCVPTDMLHSDSTASTTPIVPSTALNSPVPMVARSSFLGNTPPVGNETGLIVDKVGKQIVAANPALGMKPIFLTLGSPQPEVFHQGTGGVFITEGLVKQCKTEGQLAAVLSWELGRMVAEREALASPQTHDPEKPMPIAVSMGNSGQFSGLDQLQQTEAAKLSGDRRRPSKKFVPPDPDALARGYLEAAGFDRKELDGAAPLLAQADRNYIIEKQFKGPSDTPTWQPK
ncbi:MAG TPA: hypothetical protein VE988_27245 [Gemmataceae bacterium]|nr:hypothetical protein [Gemmataceae bacterium]